MALSKELVFDVRDLDSLAVVCSQCGTQVLMQIDKAPTLLMACSTCNTAFSEKLNNAVLEFRNTYLTLRQGWPSQVYFRVKADDERRPAGSDNAEKDT